jgi:hypothetical protein
MEDFDMPTIFISYRRDDSQSASGRLTDYLGLKLKGVSIFRDVKTISPGDNFVNVIRNTINTSDIIILIIGQRWLSISDSSGKRRLEDENDYHRQEIVAALQLNKTIIPILVDGAHMPEKTDLPNELHKILEYQAWECSDERWDYDADKLLTVIRKKLSLPESGYNKRLKVLTTVTGTLLVVIFSLFIWNVWINGNFEDDKNNLLKNGGFEKGFEFWGTGYYETDIYKGSLGAFWASRVGSPQSSMTIADVRADIDADIHKSGSKSLKIINNSSLQSNIFGSMSQRITGLMKNTNYLASYWVKAERANRGTFEITVDQPWKQRTAIDPGTYDWKKYTHIFNTGDNNFIDFRIITEEPGTVWVDNLSFSRVL